MYGKRLPKHKKGYCPDVPASLDERTYLILQRLLDEANRLDDPYTREEWMGALQIFASTGDLESIMNVTKWRRRPVDIETFMFDPLYLGMERNEIYPAVLEACHALDTGTYVEAVLKGALGTGKTTIANFMLARELYKVSCLRNPQRTFGIKTGTAIVFTIQSVRATTARKAVFDEFGQVIKVSPYFNKVYPYDKNIVSEMIFHEQNVHIMPVSSSNTGVISMNVIGGILDEMNFMQKVLKSKSGDADDDGSYDQAKRLYNTLSRRRKSRFTKKGKLPGILFVVSSSRFPDDFTEIKAAEAESEGGTDPSMYVYQHSQWSAKPRDSFLSEFFKVQIGNLNVPSKVLDEGEEANKSCRVIDVPMDFYNDFVKDVDGSLRDFAGETVIATRPFIGRRDMIYHCMETADEHNYKNIYNVEEIDLSLGIPRPVVDRLRLDIHQPRACHIDLGLNRDACGFAVGHIGGTKVMERTNMQTGEKELEILPVIAIDCVLRIVPPPGGEIEFAKVRKLVTSLRDDYGLPIEWVTYDGFESVDSRQILRKKGFKTDHLSVEKLEHYRSLRDTIYDKRLLIPKHNFLAKELSELEYARIGNKEKVDHRANGTKDVADAVCGVTSFLLSRRSAWAGLITHGSPKGEYYLAQKEDTDSDEEESNVVETNVLITRRRNIPRKRVRRVVSPQRRTVSP